MSVPLILAPMAEISHRAFRELAEGFGGCDCYFTEMISAGALLADGPFEKWYVDTGPVPEKLVFQIVGHDSGQICQAAAFLDKLDCAGIDINMGCSAPIIRKSGGGAAWMASIDKAGQLIAQARPQVKRRLSVKLRIGFNDDFEYLANFCRRLEAEGVEMVTLHPRMVTEKFTRTARWEYVGMLKKELKIPVTGNGDVASAADLVHRAAGPCDAVMIGRAAIKHPWIFTTARKIEGGVKANEIEKPGIKEIEETGLRFLELLAQHQPPEFHTSRAKRFFGLFCDNLKFGNYLLNELNRENTLHDIEEVWRDYFIENEE